jgi:hypothetical protein
MNRTIFTAAIIAACTSPTHAQHAGDVLLDIGPNGAIRTNLDAKDGPIPERVFGSEFGEVFVNFTDEPGFDSEPGTFPVPSAIGFTILGALRAWDGASFATVPTERIEIAFGPLGPVLTPLDDTPVSGFTLGVGSNGQWHRHLEYALAGPADDGVYLLELELFSTHPSVGASEPFWIVFNQNVDESVHDVAIDWVRETYLAPCRADANDDGAVNSQDFFDFLTAFFASEADFNTDGVTNSQDFFDFLGVFFVGCV